MAKRLAAGSTARVGSVGVAAATGAGGAGAAFAGSAAVGEAAAVGEDAPVRGAGGVVPGGAGRGGAGSGVAGGVIRSRRSFRGLDGSRPPNRHTRTPASTPSEASRTTMPIQRLR